MPKPTANKIKLCRVAAGSLAAGIVTFAVAGIVNHGLLMADWDKWRQAMGGAIHPPSMQHSMILWALACLVYGIIGMTTYVGIRPRFGAGFKTAVLAGLMVWAASYFANWLNCTAMGVIPHKIAWIQMVGGLVGTVLGVVIGASLYKEED